jgi:hypothetical protein
MNTKDQGLRVVSKFTKPSTLPPLVWETAYANAVIAASIKHSDLAGVHRVDVIRNTVKVAMQTLEFFLMENSFENEDKGKRNK